MNARTHCWWKESVYWIVGGTFFYAGAVKIGDPQAFADSMATFHILPVWAIPVLALGLPLFEIFCGLWAMLKRRPALLGILVLTLIFAFVLTQALARGLKVDCGCFGSGPVSVWKTGLALGRDLVLGLMAYWLYRTELSKASPRSALKTSVGQKPFLL